MIFYFDPYVAPLDQHVALLSLLALAGVSHVSSIFKAGTTWDPLYIILTILLFFLPLVAYVVESKHRKSHRSEATTRAAQGLVLEAKVLLKMLPRVFKKIDVDGNGALLYVSDLLHRFCSTLLDTRCRLGCGAGLLDREEVRQLLEMCSATSTISDTELETTMKQLDVDGSGEVDLDEFLQYFRDKQDDKVCYLSLL